MIELPSGVRFAEVVGSLGAYCLQQVDPDDTNARPQVTLCGAPVHAGVPDGWGPDEWSQVHRDCVRALLVLGRCPVCRRLVPCESGRVGTHGDCLGVSMRAAT